MISAVDKTHEHKGRAAASTLSQKKSGAESALPFSDNRVEAITQRKIQEMADSNAQAKTLKSVFHGEKSEKQHSPVVSHGTQPIQRFAYVGNRQVMENYAGIEHQPGQIGFDNPTATEDAAMSDRFYRYYNTIQEFHDHLGGQPVDVGLIKNKALWYRLPFSTGFFVLGENHGVLNYRKIIQESNQTGDILGEGGTVPIDYYSEDSATRQGKETTKAVGGATEHPMESVFAKTSYALASLADDHNKRNNPQAPFKRPEGSKTLQTDAWFQQKELEQKDVLRDPRKDPYFMDGPDRVYLDTGEPAVEQNYSRYRTAIRIARETITAIDTYKAAHVDALDFDEVSIDRLKVVLGIVTEHFTNIQFKTPKQTRSIFWNELTEAIQLTDTLARTEIVNSTIDRGGLQGQALIDDQAQHEHQNLLGKPCTLRDIFMYEAIVDASARHFKMAGIGNNHLIHLRTPLNAVNIPNILYTEFMDSANGFTRNATEVP